MLEFKLGPPRGHSERYAVALISSVEGNPGGELMLDKVQFIEPGEVTGAIKVFQKLRHVDTQLQLANAEKRAADLCLPNALSGMKRCRTLQAVPTDKSLPDESAPSN
jgi:hypothetical protein